MCEKTSTNIYFIWNDEMQKVFDDIKEPLYSLQVLSYTDLSNKLIVATDAPCKVIGAVLSEKDNISREHPIKYASR